MSDEEGDSGKDGMESWVGRGEKDKIATEVKGKKETRCGERNGRKEN